MMRKRDECGRKIRCIYQPEQFNIAPQNIRGEIPEIFGSLAAPITRADFVLESIATIHFTQSLNVEIWRHSGWSGASVDVVRVNHRCCEFAWINNTARECNDHQRRLFSIDVVRAPKKSVIAFNLRSRMLIISILSGSEYVYASASVVRNVSSNWDTLMYY